MTDIMLHIIYVMIIKLIHNRMRDADSLLGNLPVELPTCRDG